MEREGQRERRRDSRQINSINGPSKAINRAFLPPFVSRERGGSAPAETFAPTLISFDNLGISTVGNPSATARATKQQAFAQGRSTRAGPHRPCSD